MTVELSADAPPTALDLSRSAFFLDFDGTLAPIVARPEAAAMTTATANMVKTLARRTGGAVAIVSGRALADLDARAAPLRLPAAGSHGFEIRAGVGAAQTAGAKATALEAVAAEVAAFADAEGLLVERKPGAVTLHYRSAPHLAARCRGVVDDLAAAAANLRPMHGAMVSELTLCGVDKGAALQHFMETPPFRGRTPIMAGDDVTDEFGFRAAARLGGFGVKVGDGPSEARYRARDIDAFLAWLGRIVAQ